MKVSNPELWAKYVESNSHDPYGKACVDYALRWAGLMEARLAESTVGVGDVAKQASYDVDIEGITGFMYGCAVRMLAECWEHGEELRRWHNLDTQIHDEGERANRDGGVLNPALLVMDVDSRK